MHLVAGHQRCLIQRHPSLHCPRTKEASENVSDASGAQDCDGGSGVSDPRPSPAHRHLLSKQHQRQIVSKSPGRQIAVDRWSSSTRQAGGEGGPPRPHPRLNEQRSALTSASRGIMMGCMGSHTAAAQNMGRHGGTGCSCTAVGACLEVESKAPEREGARHIAQIGLRSATCMGGTNDEQMGRAPRSAGGLGTAARLHC